MVFVRRYSPIVISRTRRATLSDVLGLERNLVAVSVAMFLLALGEQLWKRFLPKYLEALGAPIRAIGLFGTCENVVDGLYQYPGGWIADRYGRRHALLLFVTLATIGYVVYWAAPSWPFVFVALVLAMAWSSMASPTLFAVVGDSLPPERRAVGFTVQSILRRIPIVVAPTLGGVAIVAYGVRGGVHVGLVLTIVLALITLFVVSRVAIPVSRDHAPINVMSVWRSMPEPLRWLLASDVCIRTCDALVDIFLVLYAINVVGLDAPQYGALVAVQMLTAILSYLPSAPLADRIGRKPFVIATFIAFTLFPLAVVMSGSFLALCGAFVIGGLREIGEPARKALIVDLAVPRVRARTIGLYYLIRSLCIAPAAYIGGLLWEASPRWPFYVAGMIGAAGVVMFVVTVDEAGAG